MKLSNEIELEALENYLDLKQRKRNLDKTIKYYERDLGLCSYRTKRLLLDEMIKNKGLYSERLHVYLCNKNLKKRML